ncbi:hypothetical protein N9N03_00680 [Chlamydiia bacterium]|nr:hypothetical protein [Chlamydiia bacterium]
MTAKPIPCIGVYYINHNQNTNESSSCERGVTARFYNDAIENFDHSYTIRLIQKILVPIIGPFELTYLLAMSLNSLSKFEFKALKNYSLTFISTLLSMTAAVISIPLSLLNCYEFNVFLDENNTISISSSYFQEQCESNTGGLDNG